MIDEPEGLVDDLEDVVGSGLRSVATYDSGDYERLYVRADIDAEYTDEERVELYKQVEIEGMGYSHLEGLFHTGELECAIYGFEEALMFQFPGDDFAGLFVTVDRDVTLNPESIIQTCSGAVDRAT